MEPIMCDVTLCNRLMATMGRKGSGRKSKSFLRVITDGNKSTERFVQHFTNQNRQGQLYKIKNNIQGVFTRFMHEGRATIQFKAPAIDMIIQQAEEAKLKEFISTVRHDTSPNSPAGPPNNESVLSRNGTLKTLKLPVYQKSITNRSDYPVTSAFPATLTHLRIRGISLSRIEPRITRLSNLQTLDLSSNNISKLPLALGTLPLKELILSYNHITLISPSLFNGAWRNSLRLLDLKHNQIRHVPFSLRNLNLLVSLKLDGNRIFELPQCVGQLTHLRFLSVSGNLLKALPYSIIKLRLQEFAIDNNPLENEDWGARTSLIKASTDVPALVELSARVIANTVPHLTAADVPFTLLHHLNNNKVSCFCGNPCFSSYGLVRQIYGNLRAIGASFSSRTDSIPWDIVMCSQKCLVRFMDGRQNFFL